MFYYIILLFICLLIFGLSEGLLKVSFKGSAGRLLYIILAIILAYIVVVFLSSYLKFIILGGIVYIIINFIRERE
ncbi:hypothetical protein CPJCM30710_07620 [Clostridium polyendosporum]|uniref:Uncharacterized protein n=1 Tax=Clostridium polyendosporum TaxID=69208 RepID=A0A919VG07_9CLOT|nr:hypothetical protein [Clostridium polyendosporum]GIM28096.1 hypothetical protein CPJCM30710_07620 [Clostridium polyendosporum]